MATVDEAIEHLKKYYKPDQQICMIIWQEDDVTLRAEEIGVTVSKETAEEILEEMEQNHDATLGISWDTIDYYLSNYAQTNPRGQPHEHDQKTL